MNEQTVYNQQYYNESANGRTVPYTDTAFWSKNFAVVAQHIVDTYHPKTVLDAGCALGYLVAALRDLGVEAYGIDVSEYAISQVREDVKPFCAVGSLTDQLPDELPGKYDLVTCIEVLEHLSVEDGRTAIGNLCKYSDQILFSSSPSDFEDITHINVQKREYWSGIFAQNHFYDAVFSRPTWLTPHAVIYRKNEDVLQVISDYERFIRHTDAQMQGSEKPEFSGKVYFNLGSGENEKDICEYAFHSGSFFQYKFVIPAGCKSIRIDPVEGYGCLIRNLNVRSDSAELKISHTNGMELNDLRLFKTIDPQVYFEGLPQDAHWIELEAEVFLFDSSAWIKLYDSIENLINTGKRMESEADAKQQELFETKQLVSELHKLADSQGEHLVLLENECSANKLRLQETEEEKQKIECELQQLHGTSDAQIERIASIEKENTLLKTELAASNESAAENEKVIADLENVLESQAKKITELEETCAAHWKEIQDYSNLVAYERNEAAKVLQNYNAISNSTIWRMTKPLRFVLNQIKKFLIWPSKRALRLVKKALISLRHNGLKITIRKIKNKLSGKQEVVQTLPVIQSTTPHSLTERIPRNPITGNPVDSIQTILVDEPVKRLNLVTDTINSDSLLGGVATALIVATEFANKWGYELRIITRNTETNPLNYENIIKISGIKPAEKVSFYSDHDRFIRDIDYKMEISPDDIFFATSWWSAMAIAETTIRKRFFYIIQEVETFFYNYGGERMLCEQVMQNPNIDFIINSGYLHKYFEKHDPQIVENGCYFEPAFPAGLYSKKVFTEKNRYKLFFYSRPNNPRNLYTVGVEMLKKAVEKGIIDTNEWDIYCVGQNSPIISFNNGAQSQNLGQLSWTEYAKFLADVDLGLCLMYTPHPSYPPFDVASSGGVVLSNKMLNKTSFDVCKNVILADLDEESFMESFREAVALAKNMQLRKKNYEENTIPRSWHNTLEETISYMKGKCEDV